MSYKLDHTPVSSESYVRCAQVVVDNRLGFQPVATFHRERIIGLGAGQIVRQPLQPISLAFQEDAEVEIVDPETGHATGETVTHQEIYALIYSAFFSTATSLPEVEQFEDEQ